MTQVLIYLLYMVCTSVLAFFINKNKSIFTYIILLLIVLLWSSYTLVWSYEIVGDRFNYVMWFKNIYPRYLNNFNLILEQNNELGWVTFNVLLCKIITNEKIILYIYMIVPIMISIIFMYKQKFIFYKIHFLFCLTFIPYYCTYLCRQMYSYGFGLLAIHMFMRNKKIIGCFLVIIAMLFHQSAVVIFLVFILFQCLDSKKKIIVFSLFSVLIIPFIPSLINIIFNIFNITKWKINNNIMITLALIKSLPYFLIFIIGIKNYSILKKQININFYLIMTFLSGYFWITTLYGTWYYRLNIYLLFGFILLSASCWKHIKRKEDVILLFLSEFSVLLITLREIFLMSLY